ncbi:hypothetical protein IC582_008463 [Cucumis melo]|uniref:Homing endonuclease LAGLIDADG domain-containing protein n=1 Tax=Cucumis melo TaxID=3656 RepID=A0A9I9DZJ9_CUCME
MVFSMSIPTSAFSTVTLLRSLTLSLSPYHHYFHYPNHIIPTLFISSYSVKVRQLPRIRAFASGSFVKQLVYDRDSPSESEEHLSSPYSNGGDGFHFENGFASVDLKHLGTPALEVKELDELPEQWRRSKLAWLCKELPAQKPGTVIRLLNAQRKWMGQDDATYLTVHCLRIRENETAFRVYKWMMQQHWYRFDYALSTKLADYMGKERKFSKCREVFDDIINQGCVPSESTFHILIVAYLSAPVQGCIEEASTIYNRMIQLGGYQPRLSLHSSLFRALMSKPGDLSKHHLKQAEFIYHNLVTSGLELHKDIYGGLIWLHSYQDTIDKERIVSLRKEMQQAGIKEEKEVLLSILRASSKMGDVVEAERLWQKLKYLDGNMPYQAFVYKMEVYAKMGKPMKALEIFREMEQLNSTNAAAYQTIIGILCKFQEIELAESIMAGFIESNLKPLTPAYVDMMNMFFNLSLHDKLELTFSQCLEKCKPNRTIYSIYLDSLVKVGNLDRAEEIFSQMETNGEIGVNARSCNLILCGYLLFGNYMKAEKIYDLMCQKKYDIDPPLMEKLDYVLSLSRKEVKKPMSLKLSKEQREILVGLLLGGLEIESDEERKNHRIQFEFHKNCKTHSVLRRHIYEQYHKWLHSASKLTDGDIDIPYKFCTVSHSYFGFYADQFWPRGRQTIPNLIHRWLSPRALAYWYMYGGCRTSSGDILLKLKGSHEGVEKIVKSLREKSMHCKVKRKGSMYWIGLLGSNATWFWKLIEPFILDDLKESTQADSLNLGVLNETENINFDSQSDSVEETSN